MALSDEQIHDCFQQNNRDKLKERRLIARAIEAEVRRQDESLIRQLVAALSLPCDRWNSTQSRIVRGAIDAANAWLEGK